MPSYDLSEAQAKALRHLYKNNVGTAHELGIGVPTLEALHRMRLVDRDLKRGHIVEPGDNVIWRINDLGRRWVDEA